MRGNQCKMVAYARVRAAVRLDQQLVTMTHEDYWLDTV